MKLTTNHIQNLLRKVDPLLENALKEAAEDDVLRCVMVLGPDREDGGEQNVSPEVHPSDFPSKRAFREALIEQRQDQLAYGIRDTLQQLEECSLRPRGGQTSRTVVVEGPARQILCSLALPGVRHASLDRKIGLIRPDRGEETARQKRIEE